MQITSNSDKTAKIVASTIILIAISMICYFAPIIVKTFASAFIIAYLLNSLVNLLKIKFKISHNAAILLVCVSFLAILLFLLLFLIPLLLNNIIDFFNNVPIYISNFFIASRPIINKIILNNQFLVGNFSDIEHNIRDNALILFKDLATNLSSKFIDSSMSFFEIISLFLLLPIIIIYFLKDWHKIIYNINKNLPDFAYSNIIKIVEEIDITLKKYLSAQFIVCIILALFYGSALHLASLNFGFLIGFLTGFFSFIPFVAIVIGFITALIVAIFDWGLNLPYLTLIFLIFIIGQFVEGNFITPKLVGDKIGINAMWIIFGLLFFAAIFGFIGILFAMPLIAISSVIIRHFIAHYQKLFITRL